MVEFEVRVVADLVMLVVACIPVFTEAILTGALLCVEVTQVVRRV